MNDGKHRVFCDPTRQSGCICGYDDLVAEVSRLVVENKRLREENA